MFNDFLKSLSILKKFLFINLIIFLVIGSLTLLYIGNVKPDLIKNKKTKHTQVINNTIEHILRLNIKFERVNLILQKQGLNDGVTWKGNFRFTKYIKLLSFSYRSSIELINFRPN